MALILWCNDVSYFLLSRMLTLPFIFAARFVPFDGLGEHGGEVAQHFPSCQFCALLDCIGSPCEASIFIILFEDIQRLFTVAQWWCCIM